MSVENNSCTAHIPIYSFMSKTPLLMNKNRANNDEKKLLHFTCGNPEEWGNTK